MSSSHLHPDKLDLPAFDHLVDWLLRQGVEENRSAVLISEV